MDLIVRLFLRLGALLAPPVAPQPVPVPVRSRGPRRLVDPRA
ncbi:hypothetical protein [uncultured Bosea sp.]|nr:hypothetical protein [uncultured Bosea sp.]